MRINGLLYGLVAAVLVSLALPAVADQTAPDQGMSSEVRQVREELRARWEAMTPEERQAHREEMQKRWEAMTPEERKAHRGMMRSPHAADPEHADGDGHDHGKRHDKPGADGAKDYGKDKAAKSKQRDRDD